MKQMSLLASSSDGWSLPLETLCVLKLKLRMENVPQGIGKVKWPEEEWPGGDSSEGERNGGRNERGWTDEGEKARHDSIHFTFGTVQSGIFLWKIKKCGEERRRFWWWVVTLNGCLLIALSFKWIVSRLPSYSSFLGTIHDMTPDKLWPEFRASHCSFFSFLRSFEKHKRSKLRWEKSKNSRNEAEEWNVRLEWYNFFLTSQLLSFHFHSLSTLLFREKWKLLYSFISHPTCHHTWWWCSLVASPFYS